MPKKDGAAAIDKEPFYRMVLRHELAQRLERNPRYSLRSFARMLDVDVGLLSKIMSNKRRMSLSMGARVASQLSLTPKVQKRFIESISETKARPEPVEGNQSNPEQALLDEAVFQTIADLRHYALIELASLKSFRAEARWIASRLGMTTIEAQLAIDRLLRLGLLRKNGEQLVKGPGSVTTRDKNVTSAALRQHQRQVLKLALVALENEPLERRSMTSMTMAVAADKVPLAKEIIQRFMEDLCDVMQDGPLTEIYQLGVSLYPLLKEDSR